MENDYLWNKTGEDAEIERLEKTLQVFRYQEIAPPMLPIKALPTKQKFSLFSLRFAVAFATCLALLFGGFIVWLNLQPKQDLANKPTNQNTSLVFNGTPIKKKEEISQTPLPIKVTIPPQKQRAIPVHFRQTGFSAPIRQVKRKVKPNVRLTTEEKDAYDQLMLALSITGSKLREVKNKVNGVEENSAAIKIFR